jgi:hypothetical protein
MGIEPTTHDRFSDDDIKRMTLKKINYITAAVGQGKSTTVMKAVDLL